MKITYLAPERLDLPLTIAPPPETLDPPTPLDAHSPSERQWHHRLIRLAAKAFCSACLFLVPVLPPVIALLLWDRRFLQNYRAQRAKFRVHFEALSQGPVEHFFTDVFLRYKQVPVTVHGECVQCGNCCLNRKCAFLEPIADDKFQCGIYGSYLRRFSNCGSFPLHAYDIERYQCPSYFVEADPKVLWIQTTK
jgi:hypothetical protein